MKPYLNWEEAAKRWPRLARAMQWVAILSGSEAGCALRDHANYLRGHYKIPLAGGEAVSHFCAGRGLAFLVRRAFACRAAARREAGGRLQRV